MKKYGYTLIQDWMGSVLGLKGLEKEVYAIIYGFSQDGESKFTGSTMYLANKTLNTKKTIIKTLNSLTVKGLIIKESEKINNIKFCKYYHNEEVVTKVHYHGIIEPEGGVISTPEGGVISTPNNTITNNKSNNKREIEDLILSNFIKTTGKKIRVFDKKAKTQLHARIKEGFTTDDILLAITNCFNDDYHKEFPKFLTLEFITRPDKLTKYLNAGVIKKEEKKGFKW